MPVWRNWQTRTTQNRVPKRSVGSTPTTGTTVRVVTRSPLSKRSADAQTQITARFMKAGYAFWRKCDLQVHSPRDPNWSGTRPFGEGDISAATGHAVTEAEIDAARMQWASTFIDHCVAKGLTAIALTDHHEMTMVSYVQREIKRRVEADATFDLWLFPGMELTANGGVQCLILFDADLPEKWCIQAQGKLGIAYAAINPMKAAGPKVSQIKISYPDIQKSLDDIEELKGKYIVLPNVSQGGKHTVLTDGEHVEFKRMPYVGGYLDAGQTIDTLLPKNKQRLSGDDEAWSEREIYPLPTSDSRAADFSRLGTNNVWIKLAVPTAEALRQAFLGHKSRICLTDPLVPTLVVKSVEIEDSAILGNATIELSPEFNSIIGGRGSGKSSFLEYVAFGLGKSCHDLDRDGTYSGSKRLNDLIVDTLISKNGKVTLTLIQDGAEFKVARGPATAYQPRITYPNGTVQNVATKDLRGLFPSVVYSQGELAELGKQGDRKTQLTDLLQFVDPEFKREDDRLTQDIEVAKGTARAAIQTLATNWQLQSRLNKLNTTRDSLRQRIEALEKTLPTLSDADQEIVKKFESANEFESKRLQASKHSVQIIDELSTLSKELLSKRDVASPLEGLPATFRAQYEDFYNAFSSGLAQLRKDLDTRRAPMVATEKEWETTFKDVRKARDAVLEKLGAHRTVTAQIIKLKEELTDTTNQIADLDQKIKAAGDPTQGMTAALAGLRAAYDARSTRTQEWAAQIESLSSGKIQATVTIAGDISEIREGLELVANKTGSQEGRRISELDSAISTQGAWVVLDHLRTECLAVLYWCLIGSATGEEAPATATLSKIVGDTDRVRSALREKMDVARVQAVATAIPRPEIALSFTDGQKVISFDKASEGQRAAALLFMLLEQPGGPLIVDQPEGDLDNKIITALTDKLHTAKQKRQLMFASHNANIVVNGSSELVGHLEVRTDGQRQFECAGAIDSPAVCEIITSTMEGGAKAFKDRQDKYGY